MKRIIRLSFSFFREHPIRVLLTSVATVAATCLVVWVASGYDALLKSFDEYSNLALGRFQLSVAPISTTRIETIPAEAFRSLEADPSVIAAEPMWLRRAVLKHLKANQSAEFSNSSSGESASTPQNLPAARSTDSEYGALGRPGSGPPGSGATWVLATTSEVPPFDMVSGEWIQPYAEDLAGVLRSETAANLGVNVGDEVTIQDVSPDETKSTAIRIIGLIDAPVMAAVTGAPESIVTPALGDLFVNAKVAARLFGTAPHYNLLGVALREEADITKFRFGWSPRLSNFETPLQFQEAHDIEEALDESAAAANVKLQSYATTGVAMLIALLVILCTLSMGVTERIRQFAVLRAVVMTKLEIALLIAIEGLLLASVGLIAGLVAGQLLLSLVASRSIGVLHHGASIGWNTLMLTSVSTFGGALLACLIPAWRATRVRPVDALAPRSVSATGRANSVRITVVGLVLIAVNPLLTFVFPPEFDSGVFAAMALGFLSMAAGFILIAPMVVISIDRVIGPLLGKVLGLNRKLLACQISNSPWRTIGAAVSLAVGMGLYTAIHVWCMTMLNAFIPGPWAPDALVSFRPGGIPLDYVSQFAGISGVDKDRCLPIVVEQPRLAQDITNSAERASVTRQDNVVIVGIDLKRAFSGETPLFEVEWDTSNVSEAMAKADQGRTCLVPDHFLAETGMKIGDAFALVPPEDPEHTVSYVIAGSIKLPGWHWQSKTTGFRSRTHRAAAMVFSDYESVATDFGKSSASYVWFNYDQTKTDPDQIATSAQALYADILKQDVSVGGPESASDVPTVSVMPVEQIRERTRGAATRWLWLLSQIPVIAVVIACFGVLNVMLASIRARRWEMGVLRAIGITRWELVRVVIAEGLLIGLVAAFLSVSFGIMSGWCGAGITQYISFFGGLYPDLVIPWFSILPGAFFLVVLAGLTALWPAIELGRTRPYYLLKQGRGSF